MGQDGTSHTAAIVVESSFEGDFILTSTYERTTRSNRFSIEVEAEGNGSHDMNLDRGDGTMGTLSYTRTSAELECSDADIEFTFEKEKWF